MRNEYCRSLLHSFRRNSPTDLMFFFLYFSFQQIRKHISIVSICEFSVVVLFDVWCLAGVHCSVETNRYFARFQSHTFIQCLDEQSISHCAAYCGRYEESNSENEDLYNKKTNVAVVGCKLRRDDWTALWMQREKWNSSRGD